MALANQIPATESLENRLTPFLPVDLSNPSSIDRLLDDTLSDLTDDALTEAGADPSLRRLFDGLEAHRRHSPNVWPQKIERCRNHALHALIMEDPFTRRAAEKPRGYAGDAVMLDFVYGHEEQWPRPEASEIGGAIFNFTTFAPASAGVRARRGYVADLLDEMALKTPKPEILSIAAGHLREASLASCVRRGQLGRFVAFDADAESLAEVARCYGRFGVEGIAADMRKLLANRLSIGTFDLVYSVGLFDYLNEGLARRLVNAMFAMLKPGGRLVVANFMPDVRDIGYMEAFMDWHLVYRTRHEMVGITRDVPQAEIGNLSVFTERNQNIIFLELRRT